VNLHPRLRSPWLLGAIAFALLAAQASGSEPNTSKPGPSANADSTATAPNAPVSRLFAVEIQTGPGWDPAKPPQDQAFFKEHSAHLKQMRDAGRIRAGARYGDKGLVVVVANNEAEARSWIEADPSMRAGTFRFNLSEMRVFYPGHLGQEKRP
jgi:uncharacterized protein YciI